MRFSPKRSSPMPDSSAPIPPSKSLMMVGRPKMQRPNRLRMLHETKPEIAMNFQIDMNGFVALYIFMLAAFAGWVIIRGVPAILHTPLMSGSNFVHGIVVVGALFALLNASTATEQAIGFIAVLLGAGNAAGGYAVTGRMLVMFQVSGSEQKRRGKPQHLRAGHAQSRSSKKS